MSIAEAFISELDYELPATRKLIERVPSDKGWWKPHPKSAAHGQTPQTLLAEFDRHRRELREALRSAKDEDFALTWRLVHGDQVLDTARRKDALRNTVNHFVHHRAQLTVYLRMNDVPLPSLYGPTADEPW